MRIMGSWKAKKYAIVVGTRAKVLRHIKNGERSATTQNFMMRLNAFNAKVLLKCQSICLTVNFSN